MTPICKLFVKELGFGKLNCIPSTDETYISFSKKVEKTLEMRFIDSCRFMPNSLKTLAGNFTTGKFKATQKCFSERSELMIRKGVYPYDYMDGSSKLEETQLPPKEDFFNKLNGTDISDDDYEHAQRVFKEFSCQTKQDFHNLYLESDTEGCLREF
ncbi:Hypothetical predicted protein [Mytilus galloprovincialis]|uniref:Uncharacterized protein n=1 Tax=Mytilus galloprovincialis TaxID=29158 RepID=A0A8B6HP16_MYTGA|nr:Hypothetical predicted protein [Mytilus galloprovincialis]